jgi:hypothetical protein
MYCFCYSDTQLCENSIRKSWWTYEAILVEHDGKFSGVLMNDAAVFRANQPWC